MGIDNHRLGRVPSRWGGGTSGRAGYQLNMELCLQSIWSVLGGLQFSSSGKKPYLYTFVHCSGYPRYLLFYRWQGDTIEILRIKHGMMDLPRLFGAERPPE